MIASLLLVSSAAIVQDWTPPPPPAVVPSPALSQPRFAPFVVLDTLRVVTAEEELEPLAPVVAGHLAQLLEREVTVGSPPSHSGDVVLTLGYIADEVAQSPEALSIEVFDDHVALSGTTPRGVARAAARLLQLFERDGASGAWSVPPVRIDDAPIYPWRAVQIEPPCTFEFAREVVESAYLASLSAVVVRGVPDDSNWVAELERFAAARGVQLWLEPEDSTLSGRAYLRAASFDVGPSGGSDSVTLPVLCERGSAQGLAAAVADGRRLIDARSAPLRVTPGVAVDDERRASVYGWSPLALFEGGDPELGDAGRPLVIGAQIVLAAGERRCAGDVLPVLPHFAERMWGSRTSPKTLDEFTPRAQRLVRLVDRLRRSDVDDGR